MIYCIRISVLEFINKDGVLVFLVGISINNKRTAEIWAVQAKLPSKKYGLCGTFEKVQPLSVGMPI